MPLTRVFFVASCLLAAATGCNGFIFPRQNETTKCLFDLSLGFAGLSVISLLF